MTVKRLIEHHLDFLSLKGAAQTRLSLHLSNCHIVWNHMSGLIYSAISGEKCLCLFVCLFHLNLYVPSTIFQLNRDGSSWVEPLLRLDKCALLQGHNAETPVRLKPVAPWSRVKHSTTELLRFQKMLLLYVNKIGPYQVMQMQRLLCIAIIHCLDSFI